jgi:hypothetical protein
MMPLPVRHKEPLKSGVHVEKTQRNLARACCRYTGIFNDFGYIPKQLEDTRFELLWKSHFSYMQQRG